MLQRCALQSKGWDNPLEEKLRKEFERWSQSIPILSRIRLPRCWNAGLGTVVAQELHVFVDAAATSGYGAAAYCLSRDTEGKVNVILLCS